MDVLSGYFGGRLEDYQLERIARTVMIASHNAASNEAWKTSGVVSHKMWL